MDVLHEDQTENAKRQTDLIHLTLAYHTARQQRGHPFALANYGESSPSMKRAEVSPLLLSQNIAGKTRTPLSMDELTLSSHPTTRVADAIIASLWDTYNQIHGLIDGTQQQDLHPFLLDPELALLMEEMEQADERITARAEAHEGTLSYRGAHTIHAGLEVGVRRMVTFSAIESGLPREHPFDAVVASRTFAKSDSLGLSCLINTQIMQHAFPQSVKDFVDASSPHGIAQSALSSFRRPDAYGCPGLGAMGKRARSILTRHNLNAADDGQTAIKKLATEVRRYVLQSLDELRIRLDFQETAQLSDFDRHVLNRTLLGTSLQGKHPSSL